MDVASLRTPAILIPLLPLAGFVLLLGWGQAMGRKTATSLAMSLTAGSLILSLVVFDRLWDSTEPVLRVVYWSWISSGALQVPFGLQLDRLSLLTAVVACLIGALAHIFAAASRDSGDFYTRHLAFLSLSLASALLFVLADNLLLMLVGTSGLSVASYFLIALPLGNREAGSTATKAFAMNAISDCFLIAAVVILASSPLALLSPDGISRSVAFEDLHATVSRFASLDPSYIRELTPLMTVITLLLLVGAMGKAAQIPLHLGLVHTAEGSTPASAIAQTLGLAASGVYLIARLHTLFLMTPVTTTIMIVVGALTAFLGAAIAFTTTDARKVLAYSTISQFGFMMQLCGAGAFSAALFLLFTHAFCKTALILGIGSAWAETGESNLHRMGGLRSRMPGLRPPMWLALAALGGFPLMSGFVAYSWVVNGILWAPWTLSEWEISTVAVRGLHNAGASEAINLFCILVLSLPAIILTTMYSYRLYRRLFTREPERVEDQSYKPRPPRRVETIILWFPALVATLSGLIAIPFPGLSKFHAFLSSYFGPPTIIDVYLGNAQIDPTLAWAVAEGLAILALVIGFTLARSLYLRPENRSRLKARFGRLYRFLWEGLRIERAYEVFLVKPGTWLFSVMWRTVDEGFLDKTVVDGTGRLTYRTGLFVSLFQNIGTIPYLICTLLVVVILILLISIY